MLRDITPQLERRLEMKKKLLLLAGMLVLMLAFTSCGMDMKAVERAIEKLL